MRWMLTAALAATTVACGSRNPENSASCGFANMAGATMALEQMRAGTKILDVLPEGVIGRVPVRVVGYGTVPGLAAEGAEGAVIGFEGEGFPATPGFGLVLVEDSAEVFKGVLIYDLDPPYGLPELGLVSGPSGTIPLYGARVTWAAVSVPRCPLFARVDTVTVAP